MKDTRSLEIYERNKTKHQITPPKRAISFKDWIGIAISGFALMLAGGTTYFNEVRIIGGSLADVTYDPKEIELVVRGGHKLAFMNSGNRDVVVVNHYILMDDLFTGLKNKPPCTERARYIELDFDPFVVKRGETVAKDFRIKTKEVGGAITVPIFRVADGDTSRYFQMCFVFTVTTPSETYSNIVIEWMLFQIRNRPAYRDEFITHLDRRVTVPVTIVQKSRIFGLD